MNMFDFPASGVSKLGLISNQHILLLVLGIKMFISYSPKLTDDYSSQRWVIRDLSY